MESNPKLLFINFSKGWGGLEISSANIYSWLTQRGWQIHFVVAANSPLEKRLRDLNRDLKITSGQITALKTLSYLDPRTLWVLANLIKTDSIDIIQVFKSSDLSFAVLASRLFPQVKITHLLQMLPKHSRRDPFHSWVYHRLNQVVTITQQMEQRVKELWPVAPGATKTIYHGLNPALYDRSNFSPAAERAKLQLATSQQVFGIIGQICPIKGQELLLHAFHTIYQQNPQARLIIAGAPAPGSEGYLANLQKYCQEHTLTKVVRFTGFCSDIPRLLAAIDTFVLASIAEPFGLVVIEAMASGALVIASNAGGVPEIITHQQEGLLFSSGDEAKLVQTMQRALNLTPQERQQLVTAAKNKIANKFTIQRFVLELEEN